LSAFSFYQIAASQPIVVYGNYYGDIFILCLIGPARFSVLEVGKRLEVRAATSELLNGAEQGV